VHSLSGRVVIFLALLSALAFAGCDGGAASVRAREGDEPSAGLAVLRQTAAMNGCDPVTAQVITGDNVTIEFGAGNGERYRPRCVTIGVGEAVHFKGDFARHPMTGGAVLDGEAVRDPLSPLPFVSAGTEAVFRADRPGVYPFYCQSHWILGMNGVVYVR